MLDGFRLLRATSLRLYAPNENSACITNRTDKVAFMSEITPDANNIPMDGFYNLRDGGDLPAAGGRVRAGRLLRSDEPSTLDQKAIDYFKSLPLQLVIDLRTEEEIEASAQPFQTAGFNTDHIGVLSGSIKSMMSNIPSIEALYLEMINNSGPQLAEAVAAVSDGVQDGAVVVHCTAGKDRTGVVIALSQSLLGVPRQAILNNYAATHANLDGTWLQSTMEKYMKKMGMNAADLQAAAKASGVNVQQLMQLATGSPASAMEGVLDQIESQHGSVKNYLIANGLSEEKIDALVKALVEPA